MAEEAAAPPKSRVLENKPSNSPAARAYFTAKLQMETDAYDVYADLKAGITSFVLVDPRSPASYAKGHIPGAYNLPYAQIDRETVNTALPQGKIFIIYSAGPGCNAAHKAAVRLASFNYRLKEMTGGLEWWHKNGYPVATGAEPGAVS